MTNYYCGDCGWTPVSAPRPGKDGRCEHCRSLVGQRRVRGQRERFHEDQLTVQFRDRAAS